MSNLENRGGLLVEKYRSLFAAKVAPKLGAVSLSRVKSFTATTPDGTRVEFIKPTFDPSLPGIGEDAILGAANNITVQANRGGIDHKINMANGAAPEVSATFYNPDISEADRHQVSPVITPESLLEELTGAEISLTLDPLRPPTMVLPLNDVA